MMEQDNTERRQLGVTKADLLEVKEELKCHTTSCIKDCIDPIKLTLYGQDGRNGIVGDINSAKTTVDIVKWVAGIGAFSGITGWLRNLFFH